MSSNLIAPIHHNMFFTYILFSPKTDRYYIGQTKDMNQRLLSHRAGSTRETANVQDWHLVFLESMATRTEAMALESKIKQAKNRKSIQRYISNPKNAVSAPILLADW